MLNIQNKRPFIIVFTILLTGLAVLAGTTDRDLATSFASPLSETESCFPFATLDKIKIASSSLANNYYGDYLIDFDGDGRTDVFTIDTSTFDYKFSSQAKEPWQTLRQDILPTDKLRFGDMEGDGVTDILFRVSGIWYYLPDGIEDAVPLIELNIPFNDLRIGQFDNDPKSDIFYQDPNGDWLYSSGGIEPLTPLGPNSIIPVDQYRFADLDGNGKSDIFRVAFDGSWHVSYDATSNWVPILDTLSKNVDELRFGQFDNQPGVDVLFEFSNKWFYSSSGIGFPKIATNATAPIDQIRLGYFDGDELSDIFSIALNNRWQVDFDAQGDPQFLLPTADTSAGLLTCLSGSTVAGENSWYPHISPDGNRVVFTSNADLLGEGNVIGYDLWLYEFPTQTLKRLTNSLAPTDSNDFPQLSADGNKIVFRSNADLLGHGNVTGNEIWLYDLQAGALQRITTATSPDRDSGEPSIDAIGSKIVFTSDNDFLGEGIPDDQSEVWIYDTVLRSYSRITTLSAPDRRVSAPAISQDGGKVVFHSDSDFNNEGIPLNQFEIWLYDVSNGGDLTRLTTSTPGTGSFNPEFNRDASQIVFSSDADFHGEGIPPNQLELWHMDLASNGLERITFGQPNRINSGGMFSGDGNTIVFVSDADLLGQGIPEQQYEIWRYVVSSGQIERLTFSASGSNHQPSVNADGRLVVFYSSVDFSGHGDVNGTDVWLLNTNAPPIPPPPSPGNFIVFSPFITK
jgi:Tol biopolymer transport system component